MIPVWVSPEPVEVPIRDDSKGLVEIRTYNPNEGIGLNAKTSHSVVAVDLDPEQAEKIARALLEHAARVRRHLRYGGK